MDTTPRTHEWADETAQSRSRAEHPEHPSAIHSSARRKIGVGAMLGTGLLALLLAGCGTSTATATSGSPGSASGLGAAPHSVTLTGSATDLQTTVENVIKNVEPSVVQVTSSSGNSQAIGSGEILTADGYIITNDHVVAGFNSFQVQFADGSTTGATVVGQDANDDLALIKVNKSGLHPIALGDSSKVVVGEFVVAVGSPLGLTESATFGIISATNRTATEAPNGPAGTLVGLIQTSAPINPGNSGGALVDLAGNLVGIPTLGAVDQQTNSQANGIGFAIASNRVQFIAQQLRQYGQVKNTGQGFLGIKGGDVANVARFQNVPVQSGVYISGFANDASGSSPAQQAGLKSGDIIVGINGTTVNNETDLSSVLLNDAPGTTVKLDVVHSDGSKATVSVTLGQRPAN